MPTKDKWGAKTGFEKAAPQTASEEKPPENPPAPEPKPQEPTPSPEPKPEAAAEAQCTPVTEGGTCPNCGWNLSDPVKGVEPHIIFAPTTATA